VMVLDVVAEAQDITREAQKRFPFSDW